MAKQHSREFDIHRAIEAILFLSGRAMSIAELAELLGTNATMAKSAIDAFQTTWNARGGGTVIVVHQETVQLVTHPDLAPVVEAFTSAEVRSELTRPQLEALTVIAYRGPITKAELEQIRGVNCTLILRNLLMRGLVASGSDAKRHEEVYTISMDFVRQLGVTDVRELPDYARLHASDVIDDFLAASRGEGGATVAEAPPV
jgi:segregation and condensation protein B